MMGVKVYSWLWVSSIRWTDPGVVVVHLVDPTLESTSRTEVSGVRSLRPADERILEGIPKLGSSYLDLRVFRNTGFYVWRSNTRPFRPLVDLHVFVPLTELLIPATCGVLRCVVKVYEEDVIRLFTRGVSTSVGVRILDPYNEMCVFVCPVSLKRRHWFTSVTLS